MHGLQMNNQGIQFWNGTQNNKIPSWIKNNADGAIDDDSFIQGIQFLVKNGIIQI